MGSNWEGKVFRLRNLPNDIRSPTDVSRLISTALRIPTDHVSVCSLARTCNKWEVPPSKVATIQLKSAPQLPPDAISDEEWSFPFPGRGSDEVLLLDTHFRGLTALNDPEPGKHEAEYVPFELLTTGVSVSLGLTVPPAASRFRVWQVTQSGPGNLAGTRPSCGSETRFPRLFRESGI